MYYLIFHGLTEDKESKGTKQLGEHGKTDFDRWGIVLDDLP